MRFGKGLYAIVSSVSIPKQLTIKNIRLGILYKSVQVATLGLCLTYLFVEQPMYFASQPRPRQLSMWRETGNEAAKSNSEVPHCQDLSKYYYVYSDKFEYQPTSCQSLSAGDSFTKWPDTVFFPTYVTDTGIWRVMDNQCNEQAKAACQLHGNYVSDMDGIGGSCSCSKSTSFFVKNIEEDYFCFLHGYEVPRDTTGDDLRVHRSTQDKYTVEDPAGTHDETYGGTILTLIQKSSGEPCYVSGKSVWRREDGMQGIKGTIAEWFACAGQTLDSQSDETRSFDPKENMAPHLRISGVQVDFELHYFNRIAYSKVGMIPAKHWGHRGTICVIRVKAFPMWNSIANMQHIELPDETFSNVSQHAYRYRYEQGISIKLKVRGSFEFFDYTLLLTAIVNVLVIIRVPRMFIEFVATRTLGLVSRIYRQAQSQTLDIRRNFHGIAARMMVSMNGFRALTSQGDVPRASLRDMTQGETHRLLADIFYHHMANGQLGEHEIGKLSRSVFNAMDLNHSGSVDFAEFIESCSGIEVIDMNLMANFFDLDRKRYFMERIFDTTRRPTLKNDHKANSSISLEGDTPATFGKCDEDPIANENEPNGVEEDAPKDSHELMLSLLERCDKLEQRVNSFERSFQSNTGEPEQLTPFEDNFLKHCYRYIDEKIAPTMRPNDNEKTPRFGTEPAPNEMPSECVDGSPQILKDIGAFTEEDDLIEKLNQLQRNFTQRLAQLEEYIKTNKLADRVIVLEQLCADKGREVGPVDEYFIDVKRELIGSSMERRKKSKSGSSRDVTWHSAQADV